LVDLESLKCINQKNEINIYHVIVYRLSVAHSHRGKTLVYVLTQKGGLDTRTGKYTHTHSSVPTGTPPSKQTEKGPASSQQEGSIWLASCMILYDDADIYI
jgi:hypothetical protein